MPILFPKQLYRFLIAWPVAIISRIDFRRYHKQIAIFLVMYVVIATLSAIEHRPDGSWGMPLVLFNLAMLLFILGSSELMLILAKRYRLEGVKYRAMSRALSCYGVAFTIVLMCELYEFTVLY